MTDSVSTKRLYIVVSQTGTIFSKILHIITREEYNHASLSLIDDLSLMYSFGRLNPYNPFVGGFVAESPDFGTFKRFSDTKIVVMALDINPEIHNLMTDSLKEMYEHKITYGYNYLGVFLAALKIVRKKKNCYYCSEFIREFLQKHNIIGTDILNDIVHPMDFTKIPDFVNIYCGRLSEYKEKRRVESSR